MTTKKKIIYFITKSSWGGAQKYVFDLATNISKKDIEESVIKIPKHQKIIKY
jgi:hypothetical protein